VKFGVTVEGGVFVQAVNGATVGVWVISTVSVNNGDIIGDIVGDIVGDFVGDFVGDMLNSGVIVIVLVIVDEGLIDGRTTSEGVAVIVHSVVAESVGGKYDVPVRIGRELGVRV
jgi:hypothetical protein